MARLPRLVLPFQPHHVIQRGNDRQLIFRDDDDHRFFLELLAESAKQHKVALHAYVLMPDHLHLLATPSDATGLGRMVQWVGRKYVPHFNQKHQREGSLWQGRFKASLIEAEPWFMLSCRFIEQNPVRAGLAQDPQDYPWSSYRHHIGVQTEGWITDHPLYWALGNTPFQREAAYHQLAAQALGETQLGVVRQALLKGWPLGSVKFRSDLEAKLERQVGPAKRGRPRKVVAGGTDGAAGR